MPMTPQERKALNAALTNAVDSLQAELEAYRMLLFVFLTNFSDASAVHGMFAHARRVVTDRTLLNVSPEEAMRQRRVTLAALDSLEHDLAHVGRASVRDAANVN